MWFLSLKGDVTVKGQEADLDFDFSDIFDELNMAGMAAFEGINGRWGFFTDILFADLGKKSTTNLGIKIDPEIGMFMMSFGAFYRVGTWDLSDVKEKKWPVMTLDVFGGGRYTDLEVNMKIGNILKIKGDKDWLDPIIGARTFLDLSERWTLTLEGSVGGFGAGSDSTWHAYGSFGYGFGLFGRENNARFIAGYRALYQDYSDGSGADKFEWDVTFHGPITGLIIFF